MQHRTWVLLYCKKVLKILIFNCYIGLDSSSTATKYSGSPLQLQHRTESLASLQQRTWILLLNYYKRHRSTQLQHMTWVLNCNIVLFICNIGPGSSPTTATRNLSPPPQLQHITQVLLINYNIELNSPSYHQMPKRTQVCRTSSLTEELIQSFIHKVGKWTLLAMRFQYWLKF